MLKFSHTQTGIQGRNLSRYKFDRSHLMFYVLSFFICMGIYLISFSNGLIGDDYNWLLNAREGNSISLYDHLLSPHPYGYFRPVPVLLLGILYEIFGEDLVFYRLIITAIYFFTSIVIFHLIKNLNYSIRISFITSIFFLISASHADVIFSINSVNVLLSTFFILTGLLLFSRKEKFYLPVILMFLLALLSRESSLCFIPLLLLVNYIVKKEKWLYVIIMIIIPVIIYFFLKSLFGFHKPLTVKSNLDIISLNPVTLAYNIVYFFILPVFPLKMFITFIFGSDGISYLREIIMDPGRNLPAFVILFITGIIISVLLLYSAFKILKKEIYFPLLFTISAALVYIPMIVMAERFLFLPSLGICLLIAILISGIDKRVITLLILILFITPHSISFYYTALKYRGISGFQKKYLTGLYNKISHLPEGSNILLKDPPSLTEGTLFIGPLNINEMWQYSFPDEKYNFYLYETSPGENVRIDTVIQR
jgi:hypothetical protein